jgi:hypothetical protein
MSTGRRLLGCVSRAIVLHSKYYNKDHALAQVLAEYCWFVDRS